MTFLNPLVLFGLAAAAIPLLIHLFNFRRPRVVDFSSLVFLRELQKSTMQRVKIKQWLLLVLRTLAIASLVLGFARPTTTSLFVAPAGDIDRAVAVVLDNSLSMMMRDADGQYLDQALEAARNVAELVDTGDEFYLIPIAGSGPERRLGPSANRSAAEAVSAVAGIALGPDARTLTTALSEASDALQRSERVARELYVISDFQRSTFGDDAASIDLGGAGLTLFPVGDQDHANVGITSVRVESRIVNRGEPIRFSTRVVNFGTIRVEGLVVSVYLEGERAAQSSVSLAPGDAADVELVAIARNVGWVRGYVEIEPDAFEFDDRRHFAFQIPEVRKLLMVRGSRVDTRYLEVALSDDLVVGAGSFDIEIVGEEALATTRFGSYDAIVLVGVVSLSSGDAGRLGDYVDAGGGVLAFVEREGAEPTNALLARLGAGRLTAAVGAVGGDRPVAVADRFELEHPLFAGIFEDNDSEDAAAERPEVFSFVSYAPRSGSEQTLVSLSSGQPFVQEIRSGNGVLLLLPTIPDPRWTDLPRRGLFVPLMYRAVFYLSAAEVDGGEVIIGRGGQIRIDEPGDAVTIRVVGQDGADFVPDQRITFGAVLLDIPATAIEPGLYDIVAAETLLRRFAFNLDASESDLRRLSPDQAAEQLERITGVLPGTPGVELRSRESVQEAVTEARTGVELWKTLVALALAFLVGEMLVARHWRPEEGQ